MTRQIPEASLCTPCDSAPQQHEADGTPTWLIRGSTFVVAVSRLRPGAVIARAANPDEYMVFLPKGVRARLSAGTDTAEVDGACDTLAIVPPGASSITVTAVDPVAGPAANDLARIFSHRAPDLMAAAGNAARHPALAPDAPPPPPPAGFRLRVYPLDQYTKSDSPARPFRSTNMLVNAFVPRDWRRDTRKMTPHAHEDFDQASLALQGGFIHHLRYPWIADMNQWREDQHHAVGSPSVVVIPARALHTSQDTGTGWAQLVDIFAPPRPDFVEKPGWLCNEADYPS